MITNILSSPDCPCLDQVPTRIISQGINETAVCDLISRRQDLFKEFDLKCPLDPDYGLSCQKHDLNSSMSCQNSETQEIPGYCYKAWCYVDPDTCFSSNHIMFEDTSGSGIYYSYSTCSTGTENGISKKKFQEKKNALDDAEIEVVFPGYRFPFYFKSHDSDTYNDTYPVFEHTDLQGAFVEYFYYLLKETNVKNYTFNIRSGGSTTKSPNSTYTAAVTDVNSGLADMAVGNFWVTSERLMLTTFTIPIYSTPLYLFELKKTEGNDIGFAIKKTLRPFTNELWAILVLCVFAVGIASVCYSNANGHSAWHEWLDPDNYPESSARAKRPRAINVLAVYVAGINRSFVEYFGQSSEQVPESPFSHKFLTFGFGFFILVVCSTYTANLASFLTVPKLGDYIQDMDEAVESNLKICLQDVLVEAIESRWEKLKDSSNLIQHSSSGITYIFEASEKLKKRECDVFIGDSVYLDFLEDDQRTELCEKEIVSLKDPVITMNWALPIQSKYASEFSKLMVDSQVRFEDILSAYSVPLTCEIFVSKKAAENSQIGILQMAFPFLILTISMSISIFLKLEKTLRRKFRRRFKSRRNRSPQECEGTLFTKPTKDEADLESKQDDIKAIDVLEYKYRLEMISLNVQKLTLNMNRYLESSRNTKNE